MTETRIRVKTTLGVTDHNLLDNRFIDNQHTINAISGLEEALESKQNILTAGENIEISEEGVISATDTTYTAGENIEISEEGVISANVPEYSAGTNVFIDNGVISAVDTTYTAGTGIDITNGVISNTQTSAEWGNIEGNINSQTDLKNALDAKANSADLATVATSGAYSDLSGTPTLATVATSGDYDDLSNKPTIPTITDTYSRVSHDGMSGIAVASAINSAIASVYKPAGSSTFAELPPLAAGIEGYVFNMTDDFTTTSDFVDGAGKDYPAGTNIVCILTRDGYKWDVLAGIVDLSGYQTLIDSSHKLNSDLVDDTNATNKFVTASDKTTWNAKQDAISDLVTIRAGASAGATAVQSSDLATVATTGAYSDLSGTPTIPTVPENDDTTISLNVQDKLQAIGVKEARTDTAIRFWHGSQAEYDNGESQTYYNWAHSNGSAVEGNWTDVTLPASANWTSVCYGNGKYVAVANGSTTAIYSSNGTSWNSATLPASVNWSSVCYGNGRFVAVSNGSTSAAYSTDGGETWNSATMPTSRKWRGVCYGNGKFIAVGNSGYYATSTDGGETWTEAQFGAGDYNTYYSIVYGNGKFVALANESNISKVSTDGTNWTNISLPGNRQLWVSVAFGAKGFVAVANYYNTGAYSADGETWESVTLSGTINKWTSVCYGNGKFVAVSNSTNKVAVSTDGKNWSEETAAAANKSFNTITYGGGKFVTLVANSTEEYYKESTAASNSVYTTDATPTTASTVYYSTTIIADLTITAVGSGTITLSDGNTYTYDSTGDQTVTYSVGELHPDYVCNIDNVGLKIGTTDIANLASYSAFTGATGSVAGSAGLVPAPAATDNDKYLKGDGTWSAVSGGGLQNTATGKDSLTILGTPTTQMNSVNIGVGSSATNSGAIAIGNTSQASGNASTAIGNSAKATNFGATAVGEASKADSNGTIAIGAIAIADGIQSYQIGWGTNSTDTTLCVGWGVNSNYMLLDGTTGKIPNDRISVDSAPTQDSTNFVTSGTIYSVLGNIETLINAL